MVTPARNSGASKGRGSPGPADQCQPRSFPEPRAQRSACASSLHPRDSSRTACPLTVTPYAHGNGGSHRSRDLHRAPGWVVPVPADETTPTSVRRGVWAENGGAGKVPAVESSPGSGSQAQVGHYLPRGAPLHRRPARRGPGPRGAGSGSRAAGRAPRAPQPSRGSRWPGRNRWSVAWSVPKRDPGPEPPGPPGRSLAPRSPPPAPHGPRCRHLAPRPPQAPGTPPQGTPGAAARSAPDQKLQPSRNRGASRTRGQGQVAAGGGTEGAGGPACGLQGLRRRRRPALSYGSKAILSPRPRRRLGCLLRA